MRHICGSGFWVRAPANQTTEANIKKALEGVLSACDTITAELAKGNPAVVVHLQALLLKTHELVAR